MKKYVKIIFSILTAFAGLFVGLAFYCRWYLKLLKKLVEEDVKAK